MTFDPIKSGLSPLVDAKMGRHLRASGATHVTPRFIARRASQSDLLTDKEILKYQINGLIG
jgi:hypothetical protein